MNLIEIFKNLFKNNIQPLNNTNSNIQHSQKQQDIIKKKQYKITIPERTEPQPKFLSSCKEIPFQSDYEAYFKNGILFDVKPRNKQISLYEDRQTAYHARYIISDGIRYDLENAEDIKIIHIPKYLHNRGMCSPTMNLDYILKMRIGTENRPELAVPLAYKTAELMIASPILHN